MHVRTVLLALIALSLVADQAAAARTTPTVVAGPSTYGVVLFDGHGNALYAFTRDPPGTGPDLASHHD